MTTSKEDNLLWKTTCIEIRPPTEDRWPLMKTTSNWKRNWDNLTTIVWISTCMFLLGIRGKLRGYLCSPQPSLFIYFKTVNIMICAILNCNGHLCQMVNNPANNGLLHPIMGCHHVILNFHLQNELLGSCHWPVWFLSSTYLTLIPPTLHYLQNL